MNRLTYDSCSYNQALAQSVSPVSYILDPIKYEHCKKCRPELGLVGGTAVSHIQGNLVDLENDLRGQNRPNTLCPEYKFIPSSGNVIQGKEYIKPVSHPKIDLTPKHLNACQFTAYPSIPLTPPMNLSSCKK